MFLANGKHDLHGCSRPSTGQCDLVAFKLHWQLGRAQTEALREFIEIFLFSGGYGGLALVERDVANLCLVVRRSELRRIGGWTELLASVLDDNPMYSIVCKVQKHCGPGYWPSLPFRMAILPDGHSVCGVWAIRQRLSHRLPETACRSPCIARRLPRKCTWLAKAQASTIAGFMRN